MSQAVLPAPLTSPFIRGVTGVLTERRVIFLKGEEKGGEPGQCVPGGGITDCGSREESPKSSFVCSSSGSWCYLCTSNWL